MQNFNDSVMVALLPTTSDWCHIDLPHLTLVYAGKVPDLTATTYNDMGKVVLELSRRFAPLTLDVMNAEVLGEEPELVDVLTLQESQQLLAMRTTVEKWNASKHSFKPHVTVGPVGSLSGDVPNRITFDRIMLGWGNAGFICRFSNRVIE